MWQYETKLQFEYVTSLPARIFLQILSLGVVRMIREKREMSGLQGEENK